MVADLMVSNSELRTFKDCRRSWWLQYVRQLRRRYEGPGPLSLGTMVHHVLEQFYTAATPEAAEDYADSGAWRSTLERHVMERAQALEDAGASAYIVEMHQEAELAAIMLEGYFDWLKDEGADGLITVSSAEEEITAYIGEIDGCKVTLRGKLDTTATVNQTGERLFMDHKTVANLTDLPKIAHLDEQQLTYGLLQRLSMQGVEDAPRAIGGLFNMLRKVKRTARANPPFYGRYAVYHNDEEYRSYYLRVWGTVRDLVRVRRELENGADHRIVCYPNPSRDCSWKCAFFSVCQMFDDGSDVESVLADAYETCDPYERYVEKEKA